MLKDLQFWTDIEDTINDENSDYVVLDLYFTMRTYRVLTNDELSQLPVAPSMFYNIYNRCRNKVIDLLGDNYTDYITELQYIAKDVPELGVLVSITRVFEFIKQYKETLSLFCAMGVLNALEDYDTNDYTLVYLQAAKDALFKFITSL